MNGMMGMMVMVAVACLSCNCDSFAMPRVVRASYNRLSMAIPALTMEDIAMRWKVTK